MTFKKSALITYVLGLFAALLMGAGCGDNVDGSAVVAVVGGGAAGLMAARTLLSADVDVTVYEASGRTGGRMFTRTGLFPSWSATGDRYVGNDGQRGISLNSILLFNGDGSRRSVVFSDPKRSALAPDWSRAPGRIAFGLGVFFQTTTGGGDGKADIATIGVDGQDLQVLTNGQANYGFPSWSGDGRRIVYREALRDRSAILVYDVESRQSRTILEGPGHYNFTAWSPTADLISFTADLDADGDSDIYTVRPDGSGLKRLTHAAGNDAHQSWSPDGRWIAFTSARQGFKDESVLHPGNPQPTGEITVMRADGSDSRVLTDNPFEDGSPAWRPSGQRR